MDDVEFYAKHVQFQEKVGKIQQERAQLERQFYSMTQSNKNLQSLRALKLRSYWKQICDREKKARERNAELMSDFAATEAKIATLQAQSSNLRRMKKQYEDEVAKMYPKWRQEAELARAQRQLEEKGINVSDYTKPRRPSAGRETFNPAPAVPAPSIQDALFKLVPVGYQASPQAGQTDSPSVLAYPTPESAVVAAPKTDSLNQTVPDSIQDEVSETYMEPITTLVPPLDLPSSAERDRSDASAAGHEAVSVAAVESLVHPAGGSKDTSSTWKTESARPPPVTPTRLFTASSTVHQFQVEKQAPSEEVHASREPDVLDFISDVTSETSKDESVIDSLPDNSNFAAVSSKYTPPPSSPVKLPVATVENTPRGAESPRRVPMQNKIVVPSPGQYGEANQADNVESFLSESLTTDNTSPRTDAPLTSSAAYQALVKNHDLNLSSTLGGSGFYEDEDDLEDVLSPKGHHSVLSEASSEPDSVVKASPVVHIPTATQNSDITTSSKDQHQAKPQIERQSSKAPWDTDTEDDSFDSRHQVGGGQMNDDDFDFYD